MGDRANILVGETFDGKFEGVYLYTHWGGGELPATLQRAMKKHWRWTDSFYLARIIFCEMVKGAEMNETGYGISARVGDGDNRILEVDTETQMITRVSDHPVYERFRSWTFDEYCELGEGELNRVWSSRGEE